MKNGLYVFIITLLLLYLFTIIAGRVNEFKNDSCEYNMDEETECCIMKDLMTSCRIIGVVDSVKAGSVLIKILEFDNSFHFFPKEYRPKFTFVKSGSHEYLDINACKSELEYLDSGMPVEKLAGEDYVQIGTVRISLFNDRNHYIPAWQFEMDNNNRKGIQTAEKGKGCFH